MGDLVASVPQGPGKPKKNPENHKLVSHAPQVDLPVMGDASLLAPWKVACGLASPSDKISQEAYEKVMCTMSQWDFRPSCFKSDSCSASRRGVSICHSSWLGGMYLQ
jgi:hypothetical protein